VIGYAIFLLGTIAEILGMHIGLVLPIPGGLWEFVFGFWLIIRDFQPAAYAAGAAVAGRTVVTPPPSTRLASGGSRRRDARYPQHTTRFPITGPGRSWTCYRIGCLALLLDSRRGRSASQTTATQP
jgi:hypothetical protein